MHQIPDKTTPPLSGVKLIVLDLDGTLVDAFQDITNAVNHMLVNTGREPLPLETVKRNVGSGMRELVARILGTRDDSIINASLPLLVEYYKSHTHDNARIYDGVIPTIKWLRSHGIKTAVASNKPDVLTQEILAALGLAPLFDVIHGESGKFPRKPDPAILRHIMSEMGSDLDETVAVGDTEVDIAFARAAGIRIVSVTYGQFTVEQLRPHNPDFIINSFDELIPLIGGSGS